MTHLGKCQMMLPCRLCSIMPAGLTRVACLHESGHDTVHGGVCVRCNQYPCSAEHMTGWDVLQLRTSTHIIMSEKIAGLTWQANFSTFGSPDSGIPAADESV